jgi:hypothetical protein
MKGNEKMGEDTGCCICGACDSGDWRLFFDIFSNICE